MKVTRDVILDLWPAYQAGEVSAETRALVDEYLASDPEFASILRKIGDARRLLHDSPVAPGAVRERQTVQSARSRIVAQWLLLAAAVIMTGFVLLAGLGLLLAFVSRTGYFSPGFGLVSLAGFWRMAVVFFLMTGLVIATAALWWGFSRMARG